MTEETLIFITSIIQSNYDVLVSYSSYLTKSEYGLINRI